MYADIVISEKNFLNGSEKKSLKIINQFFKRNGFTANGKFAVIEPTNCLNNLNRYLQESGNTWEMAHTSLMSKEKIDLLLISSSERLEKLNAQFLPYLIVMDVNNDEKIKKLILPRVESLGYRVWRENDNIVFFFHPQKTIKKISKASNVSDTEIQAAFIHGKRKLACFDSQEQIFKVQVCAHDLLVPRRFDIAIKVNYARLWKNNLGKQWREYAYGKQVQKITNSKNIKEHDGSGKEGLEKFTQIFQSLIEEKNIENIPPFIIDSDGVALDGAHRIAAALIKGDSMNCYQVSGRSGMKCDSNFFRKYSQIEPCPEEILEEGAIEYCLHKNTTAIALIFPTVLNERKALEELSKIGETVYRKDIVVSPAQGRVLLRQVYLGQSWMSFLEGESAGFRHKLKSCFPCTGTFRIVLLDSFNPANLRLTKDKIRAFYNLGNHSIHITDSYEETLRMARALFNNNSIHAMKSGGKVFVRFHTLLSSFRNWMLLNDIDENNVCIDSGGVLAALGLRECRDLDFLYHGNIDILPSLPNGIDCHNHQSHYYTHSISDIIGDPRFHFWYMGVKFCTPEVLIAMKKKRGEEKDIVDIKLLKMTMPSQYNLAYSKIQKLFLKIQIWFYIFIKRAKSKIKRVYIKVRGNT